MVTVTVLSVGIAAVFRALIITLDQKSELTRRLHAIHVIDHEIALMQNVFRIEGGGLAAFNGKVIEAHLDYRHVPYRLEVNAGRIPGLSGARPVEIYLSWTERQRDIRLARGTCLLNFKEITTPHVPTQK